MICECGTEMEQTDMIEDGGVIVRYYQCSSCGSTEEWWEDNTPTPSGDGAEGEGA